jgi:hypothetical protein
MTIRALSPLIFIPALALALLGAGCSDDNGQPPPADTGGGDTVAADAAKADAAKADAPADAPAGEQGQQDAKTSSDALSPTASSAEVLAACTIIGSCVPDDGVNACLRGVYGQDQDFSKAVLQCLAKTKGCAGVKSCLGVWISQGTVCGPTQPDSQCTDANSVVWCDDSLGIHADCQKIFGVGCKSFGSGTKSEAECSSGATCSGTTKGCVGGNGTKCKNGIETFDEPCVIAGLKCNAGKCVGSMEACTQSKCEKDVVALCVRGYYKRMDCKGFGAGFSCHQSASGARCVQGTACEPDTSKHKEGCNADKLTVCHAGKVQTVDCKALGFTGCSLYGCTP